MSLMDSGGGVMIKDIAELLKQRPGEFAGARLNDSPLTLMVHGCDQGRFQAPRIFYNDRSPHGTQADNELDTEPGDLIDLYGFRACGGHGPP